MCKLPCIVQDLEVLLGRDMPLHKLMVKRLSKEDQMEVLQQLAKDNGIQLEGRPDNIEQERVLAVLTRAQKKKLHQQQSIQDKDLEIPRPTQQYHTTPLRHQRKRRPQIRTQCLRLKLTMTSMQDRSFPLLMSCLESRGSRRSCYLEGRGGDTANAG